jgi:hypothetical protein
LNILFYAKGAIDAGSLYAEDQSYTHRCSTQVAV